MTTLKPAAKQLAAQIGSTVLDATSVLTASVSRERARKDIDLELVESLEATILRVDAPEGAWEQAAAAIKKLALLRAESRIEMP